MLYFFIYNIAYRYIYIYIYIANHSYFVPHSYFVDFTSHTLFYIKTSLPAFVKVGKTPATQNLALEQYELLTSFNTVVSNHFHSVKILLFSSARSRDFDGLIGIELPVSMNTTETPIDMCRFNVQSST